MLGGIYSDQKCPICGRKFQDDGKRGLLCPEHPGCGATKFSVRFKGVHLRFSSYKEADQALSGMRWKSREGSFDSRDYQKDNPLGFVNLAEQYLKYKVEKASYRQIKYHMEKAIEFFGGKNIKEIGYADLEDFLLVKDNRAKKPMAGLSGKSRANIKATLHTFWEWLRKRRVVTRDQVPEFPEVEFDLGWRKIVDKETQTAIIEEVKLISPNIKVWLAIKWLSTYVSIRPKEMLSIQEGDFNFSLGGVLIRKPKERKPKFVPMLPEDLDIVQSFPKGISPEIPFFRHGKGYGGVKPGSKFGRDAIYKVWRRACRNLGIEGVDLYGGTKHSSVTALREFFSPEQIRRGTMHATNKAFERYYQIEGDDLRAIYEKTSGKVPGKKLVKNLGGIAKTQIIDFKEK